MKEGMLAPASTPLGRRWHRVLNIFNPRKLMMIDEGKSRLVINMAYKLLRVIRRLIIFV
jgi:hypothetical protein